MLNAALLRLNWQAGCNSVGGRLGRRARNPGRAARRESRRTPRPGSFLDHFPYPRPVQGRECDSRGKADEQQSARRGEEIVHRPNAIDEPSRSALFPRLLPRSHLRSGVPLIAMAFGGSRIVAPSIAGFMIAAAGAPAAFLLSAIGISAMIAILFLVRRGTGGAPSHGSLLDNFADSVRYIRKNEVFSKVIVAALLNAAVAMGYIHVLPVFAKDVLGVDARGLGMLASAAGIGALCGLVLLPVAAGAHDAQECDGVCAERLLLRAYRRGAERLVLGFVRAAACGRVRPGEFHDELPGDPADARG